MTKQEHQLLEMDMSYAVDLGSKLLVTFNVYFKLLGVCALTQQ